MIDMYHSSLDAFVDWSELNSRTEGDLELIRELFELFEEAFPTAVVDLESAVSRGIPEEVRHAAHTLKGMLANLSIKTGTELAANIEEAAREGGRLEIGEALSAFKWETAQLLPAVRTFVRGFPR